MLVASPAMAMDPAEPRVLVWHCDGEAMEGTGFPGCEETADALRVEMGASLAIVEGGAKAPVDPAAAARVKGALFIAWPAKGEGGVAYVLYAYDALNDHVLSKSIAKGKDRPDAAAVAFLYRNMLGTSLYADLDTIESDTELWSLAFPKEKVQTVKQVEGLEPPAPRPAVVHVTFGYGLMGYPLGQAAWHAGCLGIGVKVHELVEAMLDFGATPMPKEERRPGLRLSVHLISLRTGVRVAALKKGPLHLMPGAGLSIIVSVTQVAGGLIEGQSEKSEVDGSAFTSLLGRLYLHRHVALDLELGVEVLFRPVGWVIEGGEDNLLKMGRLGLIGRLGFVFAI